MEFIAEFIANAMIALFGLFGNLDLSPLADALAVMRPFLQTALYILPFRTIRDIFAIVCMFWSYRLCIKALKTIWDVLPIV